MILIKILKLVQLMIHHVANCAVSVNRIHHVYLRGHLHVANSSPRVQWPYTWRTASGENLFFFL